MIHINTVRKILAEGKEFSCRLWNKSGEILTYNNVVCTSTNFKNDTANILFTESRQVRKLKIITLFEINDEEIYL
jgi:hypothetical protein